MKLTKPSSNRVETESFLANKPATYPLPDFAVPVGYRLLASNPVDTEEGLVQTICLVFDGGEQSETVYKVKMIVRNEPNAYLPIKNCTQLIVWRQAGVHGHVLGGFPRLIFNDLLRSHNIMITDEQQTEDGKRFWLDRMGESFAIPNRNVYYIDLESLDSDLAPVVTRIHDFEELMETYVPIGWGRDEQHKNRVFVISTQNLA